VEAHPREVQIYQSEDERKPFEEWVDNLKDKRALAAIASRLIRVRQGNLGDCSSAGDGVFEFRIDIGPGYRVYFGQVGQKIVILLCGGDKSAQDADIRKAKAFWKDFKERAKS
jgi:putative addiction module killer protein